MLPAMEPPLVAKVSNVPAIFPSTYPSLTLPPLASAPGMQIAGMVSGTRIITLAGELPIEHLTAGDRVITRDAGIAQLLSVSAEEVDVPLIRVRAGALSHQCPENDMLAGPATLVLLRDWRASVLYGQASAMVPLSRLRDGYFISSCPPRVTRLFTLHFARPHVIYANGLEIGTGGGSVPASGPVAAPLPQALQMQFGKPPTP